MDKNCRQRKIQQNNLYYCGIKELDYVKLSWGLYKERKKCNSMVESKDFGNYHGQRKDMGRCYVYPLNFGDGELKHGYKYY